MYLIVRIAPGKWVNLANVSEIEQAQDGSLKIYFPDGQRPSVARGEAARRLLALLEEVAADLVE